MQAAQSRLGRGPGPRAGRLTSVPLGVSRSKELLSLGQNGKDRSYPLEVSGGSGWGRLQQSFCSLFSSLLLVWFIIGRNFGLWLWCRTNPRKVLHVQKCCPLHTRLQIWQPPPQCCWDTVQEAQRISYGDDIGSLFLDPSDHVKICFSCVCLLMLPWERQTCPGGKVKLLLRICQGIFGADRQQVFCSYFWTSLRNFWGWTKCEV